MSEHAIQVAIVDYLRLALPSGQRIVAVSNNPRSKATGAKEKARGLWAGFPDLILLGMICGFMEVKKPGGKMTLDQVEWELFCKTTGMNHAVVHSIEEVRAVMRLWGVKLSERVHL